MMRCRLRVRPNGEKTETVKPVRRLSRPRCMRNIVGSLLLLISAAAHADTLVNPAIDMPGYLRVAAQAAGHRESRRVSEEEFIRMSQEPGTVVLDVRSSEKFAQLHVKGAINLSFPDITIESLARTIPDKRTRILIYCNNNFKNAGAAMEGKIARASLNISTYVSLFSYGYENVYELAPLLDINGSKIEFVRAPKMRVAR